MEVMVKVPGRAKKVRKSWQFYRKETFVMKLRPLEAENLRPLTVFKYLE